MSRSMAQRRPPPRRSGHISRDPVIRLETGDFEALKIEEVEEDVSIDSLPGQGQEVVETRVLPSDPQRALPTHIYNNPNSFNPPLPAGENPSDTHPIPTDDSAITRAPVEAPAPSRVLEPAFLYVDRGPGEGRNVPIPEGELIIGRSSTSGLKISHPSVSREHAVVTRKGMRFHIRDAGSHNGTYVNGRQVSGQLEVYSDDEIAMGKAVLILRCGAVADRHRTVDAIPITDRPVFKVAIFGTAVALGILSVLVLSKLRPGDEPAAPARAPAVAVAQAPAPIPRPEPRVESPPVQPRPEPAPEPKPVRDLSGETSASKIFQEARSRGDTNLAEVDLSKRILDHRKLPKAAPAPRRQNPRVASAGDSNSGEAMALYEAGDLEGAASAAKTAGNTALANKIATFKRELTTAKSDLASKNGAGAIKHYTAALAIDDELSKGWGKLGGQIRVELAKLFLVAGMQAIDKGDNAKATVHLEKALRYDPENEKAKDFLKRIKAAGGSNDARSAADQAFNE